MRYALLLTLLLAAIQPAQAYKVSEIPGPLKENAHAVVRKDLLDLRVLSASTATVKVVYAITVLDKKGQDAARFSVGYSPNVELNSLTGKIFDAEGVVRQTMKIKDFGDISAIDAIYSFGDDRMKIYSPTITSFPYTIEYAYEQTFVGLIALPNWTPVSFDEISVEKSEFILTYPSDVPVRMRQLNLTQQPEVSNQDGLVRYRWVAEHVPAFKPEPYSADKWQFLPQVEVSPIDFVFGKKPGTMQSWESFGKWIYDLNTGRDQLPPEAIADVQKLVEGVESEREKARKVYEYMQGRSRYVSIQFGIGGLQSFPASETHRLGYGDCKALTMYTKALMQAVGVEAIYSTVFAGPGAKTYTDPAFPSQAFNHVILCLPLDGDTTWLECTSREMPFGFLGDFTDDRPSLLILPEGGKLVRTTRYTREDNLRTLRADVTLGSDGTGDASLNFHWKGLQMDNRLSDVWFQPPSEHRKKLIQSFAIPKFELKEIDHQRIAGADPALNEKIHLALPGYAAITGKRLFIPLNLENRTPVPPVVKERKYGFELGRSWLDRDTVVYHLPDGYTVEAAPAAVVIEAPYGHYRSEVAVQGNLVTYIREASSTEGFYPADQYEAFVQFRKQMAEADLVKLVLVKPE